MIIAPLPLDLLRSHITSLLVPAFSSLSISHDIKERQIRDALEIIRKPTRCEVMALPVLRLLPGTKEFGTSVASELAEKIKASNLIAGVNVEGIFLNFRVHREEFLKLILQRIVQDGGNFSSAALPRSEERRKVVVCAMQCNEIGNQIRGKILAGFVARILELSGCEVHRVKDWRGTEMNKDGEENSVDGKMCSEEHEVLGFEPTKGHAWGHLASGSNLPDDIETLDLSSLGLGRPKLRVSGEPTELANDVSFLRHHLQYASSIYIVAPNRRALHFKQAFHLVNSEQCHHVEYLPLRGISTSVSEVMARAIDAMDQIMRENEGKLDELVLELSKEDKIEEVVSRTARGAAKAAVLTQIEQIRRTREVVFDWDRLMDVRGDSGVYLEYTHARLCGIERKACVRLDPNADLSLLHGDEVIVLASILMRYPNAVLLSHQSMDPQPLMSILFELAHALSEAHRVLRVKGRQSAVADARWLLLWSARCVLGSGLKLLGVEPLERM
ncbi:uncharacterized protein VTP21DRAFT_10354 [Calcarisporiella thermophila]|uniref:uncharacterized protein n=1 Tax=Calcarisporiella thermophila TaxID=911321 RepID=UPI003742C9DE